MKTLVLLFSLSVFSLSACAQQKGKDFLVRINTEYGEMVAILYDETPKHKANFIKLAQQHYFDSLLFHRVIEGFMIQGGDPDSKKADPSKRLGAGGPGYTIDAEILPKYFHERGAIAAARTGDALNPTRASSGSQFYIVDGKVSTAEALKIDEAKLNSALKQFFTDPANKATYDSIIGFIRAQDMEAYQKYLLAIKPRVEKATGVSAEKEISPDRLKAYTTAGGAPQLDDAYTGFGKVIKGLDVIDKIATQAKDKSDRPLKDIRMKVTVEEVSKKKIEKEFGYVYPAEKK